MDVTLLELWPRQGIVKEEGDTSCKLPMGYWLNTWGVVHDGNRTLEVEVVSCRLCEAILVTMDGMTPLCILDVVDVSLHAMSEMPSLGKQSDGAKVTFQSSLAFQFSQAVVS